MIIPAPDNEGLAAQLAEFVEVMNKVAHGSLPSEAFAGWDMVLAAAAEALDEIEQQKERMN